MNLKTQIDQDLKSALLAGDTERVSTLRGLKSVILNAEVAQGARESGLPETEIVTLLAKEAKKRQESADLYYQGKASEKAEQELREKAIIETYLPEQLSEEDLRALIADTIHSLGASGPQEMGRVIGAIKQKTGAAGDGATIARLVKEALGA